MAKRKGRFEGNINFLSNLPLEECISRLQGLESAEFRFTFSRDEHDAFVFKAQLLERGIVRSEGKGRLQRWEGTLTRVNCDVKVREGIVRWLMLLATLCLLTMVAIPILFFLSAGINVLIWAGLSMAFIVFFIAMMFVVNHYAPMDDTPENLLHLITSTLDE